MDMLKIFGLSLLNIRKIILLLCFVTCMILLKKVNMRGLSSTIKQKKKKENYIMKFVIQRVKEAKVVVDGNTIGQIDKGFLVLIGVNTTDTKEIADKMVKKLINMRIFEDENGKTNLSLSDVGGSLLLISQFTLYADCKKGNRPSFTNAGGPDMANELYEYIIQSCKEFVPNVQKGIFGADMKVSLLNDGPFTIVLDSMEL